MARKVFISFLGYSNYGRCRYFKGEFMSDNLRYIQIATLDYLQTIEKWGEDDIAYILLTEGAKKKNWEDNGHETPQTKEKIIQPGLDTCIKAKEYPFAIKTIENLPDGNNEDEIFEIFDRVFAELRPGDELHFDVTHGFRYLPMLVLVLANYSKFLKNIKVMAITYGNYEARSEMGKADDQKSVFKAPIVDLLPLSLIQNWTYAAADYLRNGKSDRFLELAKEYKISIFKGMRVGDKADAKLIESIANNLKLTIEDFQICRGREILDGKHVTNLKKDLLNLKETSIKPLKPLAKELNSAFESFNSAEEKSDKLQFWNGFEAAKWCWNHQLYQQAAVILQENIVSFFCNRHQLDIYDIVQRSFVNMAFKFVPDLNNKDLSKEKEKEIRLKLEDYPSLKLLIEDPLINEKELYDAFGMITTERNDVNHNGMRKSPHRPDVIRDNIKIAIDVFYNFFHLNDIINESTYSSDR